MLAVKIFGGLGNQLFQYAFFEYLRESNPDTVCDLSDFSIHRHHHGYELSRVFGLELPLATKKELRALRVSPANLPARILSHFFGISLRRDCEADESGVFFVNQERVLRNCYFCGFWQNAAYLTPSVRQTLRKNLVFRSETINEKNRAFAEKIRGENAVSLHVRRGDYVGNSTFSGICTEEYYHKAIKEIKSRTENPLFVLFSDDLSYAKELIPQGERFVLADFNTGEQSFLDLYLMHLCQHHIIANSSFSFWGAFLNENPHKIVIAPKRWSNFEEGNRLTLDEFVLI